MVALSDAANAHLASGQSYKPRRRQIHRRYCVRLIEVSSIIYLNTLRSLVCKPHVVCGHISALTCCLGQDDSVAPARCARSGKRRTHASLSNAWWQRARGQRTHTHSQPQLPGLAYRTSRAGLRCCCTRSPSSQLCPGVGPSLLSEQLIIMNEVLHQPHTLPPRWSCPRLGSRGGYRPNANELPL